MNRLLTCTAVAALAGVAHAQTTAEFFDDIQPSGLGYGQSDAFGFGGWSDPTSRTVDGNAYIVLDGNGANPNSGTGISVPVAFDNAAVVNANGSAGFQNGNVIRASIWLASDPSNPFVPVGAGPAIPAFKMEFWDAALGLDRGVNLLFDTEADAGIFTDVTPGLTAGDWTQFVFEYTINDADFIFGNVGSLVEVRPVLFVGDFSGADYVDGGFVADNYRVEVFTDASAAAASPVDTTFPGGLVATTNIPYCDNEVAAGGLNFGATDVYAFGAGFASDPGTTGADPDTNNFAAWTCFPAGDFGAQGFSVPFAPDANGIPGGSVADGNVIRVSFWTAQDPNNAWQAPNGNLGTRIIKLEFWDTALSTDADANRLLDTEIDTGVFGTFDEGVVGSWTQFVWEYTVDGFAVDLSQVQEIRAVALNGDFSGAVPEGIQGTMFVDNIKVEVFADASAAAASPVDMTDPGLLPELDCPCDEDDSGEVDVFDLLSFLECWFPASQGQCQP